MSEEFVIEITQLTVMTVALMVGPAILVVVAVGVIANVIQTITQVRDQSLSFVPKVVAMGLVMLFSVPWYVQTMRRFTETIFALMAGLGS